MTARWLARPAVVLGVLVAASSLIRSAVAWQHTTPRYFPDEYIYAALGRSLAHGHYAIRGHATHFPAILEPLVAAPFWGLFSTHAAYQLIQAENAVAASVVVVPIYLLTRWLGLARWQCYLCCLYGLVIPSLALIPLNISDLIAYPLVVGAVAVGVRAIDAPSTRLQVTFLALATLATLARTQYFVLVPAYLVAAVALDGRRLLREHRVAFLAAIPVAAAATVAVLSFYHGVLHITRLNEAFVKWYFLQAFLLSLEVGVVLAPGAVAGLLRPRERRERAFSFFLTSFALLVFAEAAVYAADIDHFKERYLFALLPFAPIAFALYVRRGRPHVPLVVGLGVAIAVAAARLPISGYAIATFKTDSQFLYGVGWLEDRMGVGNASLLIALLATAAAVAAIAVAFKGDRVLGVATAIAVGLLATAAATSVDLHDTRTLRDALPRDLSWIDHTVRGPVTAVTTPASSQGDLFIALYWNESIHRELRLAGAAATDTFSTPKLHIGPHGELLNADGAVLFDRSGSSGALAHAALVGSAQSLTLWRPNGVPRFRFVIEHRASDTWLGPYGRIRVWPLTIGSGVRINFVLSVPADWKRTVHMHVGHGVFAVRPGAAVPVTCANSVGPVDVIFSTRDVTFDSNFRALATTLTKIRVEDVHRTSRSRTNCT